LRKGKKFAFQRKNKRRSARPPDNHLEGPGRVASRWRGRNSSPPSRRGGKKERGSLASGALFVRWEKRLRQTGRRGGYSEGGGVRRKGGGPSEEKIREEGRDHWGGVMFRPAGAAITRVGTRLALTPRKGRGIRRAIPFHKVPVVGARHLL